ncbi:MAG: hypothetical protein ABSF83_14305 [Nitrososphaerales archaeon]|jgi:putative flippase GtrA
MVASPKWLKKTTGVGGEGALAYLERKIGTLRIVKFAAAAGIGFMINETVLVLGILAVYHRIEVPSLLGASLVILGLDALALGTGDTVAFIINERVTVKGLDAHERKGWFNWLTRWSKYQLAALMGNLIIVAVQLALLATVSLFPAFGSVVGALISYPVTYTVSMHFVWGIHPFDG